MVVHIVSAAVKWLLAGTLLAGLFGLVFFIHQKGKQRSTDAEAGKAAEVDAKVGMIKLSAELARSYGIKVEPAQTVSWMEVVGVYGRVIPNPKASAEVRAPFAGTLQAAPGFPWPAPGQQVRAGQVLGRLDIRVGPQERLDLQAKLNSARSEQQGAEKIVALLRERAKPLQGLSEPGIISRKELDEVLVDLAKSETALHTATATVKLWQNALAEIDQQNDLKSTTWSQNLTAPADGEVVELTGRPGMVVEAGGVVARLVDFRQTLVRLDLPSETLATGAPPALELYAESAAPPALRGAWNRPEPAAPAHPVPAVLVGPAPQVDTASQLFGYWYEIRRGPTAPAIRVARADSSPQTIEPSNGLVGWRPGLLVKAYVRIPEAKPVPAFSVPASAILYHQGRALVYVRISTGKSDRFERREVQLLGREGDRYILSGGVVADEPVVFEQAQVLLSEEFKGADID